MMLQRIAALICLNFLCLSVALGQVVLTGVVTDKSNGSPVSNASITLHRQPSGDMLAFGITNSQGRYAITLEEPIDTVFVSFACLGYATQQFYLSTKAKGRDVALVSEAVSIKEITVKSNKIWAKRDTINYSVAGFAGKQDRTIGDVLKKLPGIDVAKNGVISYGGKAINAFYIEGMDSMDGKYALATENIPVDAIANIQIFENHQKIKVLENSSFTDRAALNLTLREASKYRWIGSAKLGAGLPVEQWEANLFLMNIAKRNQGINVVKSNNIGSDISRELKGHTLEDFISQQSNNTNDADLFDIPVISIPLVNDERFLFNQSFLVSSNNLWMLNNDWMFRVNVSGLKDRVAQNSRAVDSYHFPDDSTLVVVDERSIVSEQLLLDATFTLSANTPNFYFNDALKLVGNWSRNSVDGRGSSINNQQYETPARAIQNDFKLIKRVGGVNVSFASFNRLSKRPQSLTLMQDSPDTAFSGRLFYNRIVQDATQQKFSSNTNASFTLGWRRWSLENKLGYLAQVQKFRSDMVSSGSVDREFANHSNWTLFRYAAEPKVVFTGEQLKLELLLPVNYTMATFDDKILSKTLRLNRVFFTPAISLRYKLSPKFELFSRVGRDQDIDDPLKLSTGYVLRSYRHIERGHSIMSEQKGQQYSVGFSYRNPVSALFLSTTASYSPMQSEVSYVQSIRGIYVINSATLRSNSSNLWLVSGRVSKAVDFMKSTASLSVSYTRMETTMLMDATPVRYWSKSISLSPKINVRPASWAEVVYSGQMSMSQVQIEFANSVKQPYLRQVFQQLSWGISPGSRLQILIKGEHFYNEMLAGSSPSVFFCDLGLRLKLKRVELMADWNNILDRKTYGYSSYGGLSSTSNSYEIRPTSVIFSASFRF